MKKKRVGILGETGLVGQHYVKGLKNHPYFDLSSDLSSCSVIFSALPDPVAKEIEPHYLQRGCTIFSTASHHRLDPNIPLIIPEINPDHLKLIKAKQGCIVAKPNCTVQSCLLPLFPLHKQFQLKKVMITTLQSVSGAGKAFVLENNILPHIPSEEEKLETEPLKILGTYTPAGIEKISTITFSTHCNRVPVSLGHLACICCSFVKKPRLKEIIELWDHFPSLSLPSAPKRPLCYHEALDRPQPALDVDAQQGMGVTIGRLRPCAVLDIRFTALSHNLIRGAAGNGLLTAELAYKQGYL